MFAKRAVSAVILVAGVIALVHFGGPVIWFVVALIEMLASYELCKAFGFTTKESGKIPLVCIGLAMEFIMCMCAGFIDYKYSMILCPAIYLMIILAIYVFNFGKISYVDIEQLIFAFMYVAVALLFVPCIREKFEHGIYLVWLALIPPIASDTFAYCVGSLIGKHKLSPKVSPKKSIEGSVGGIVGGGLCTALFAWYVSTKINVSIDFIIACGVIGMIAGGVSQIGDLAASAIKRERGIKDYGNLIPGHGGALDRIDSIIYIAPVIFLGVLILDTYFM